MALPAQLLERLPASVLRGAGLAVPGSSSPDESDESGALKLGLPALERILPEGGLPRGAVTELAVEGGASLGTSIALGACSMAQAEARAQGTLGVEASGAGWCAFIDPSGSLYAPGVECAGVTRERLLVVRPPLEALARTAVRVVESRVFSVVVVDTVGVPGARLDVSLGTWPRVVRRLGLSVEKSRSCVLLVTDRSARRPLPLPVAMRLELVRTAPDALSVRVAKERHGRVGSTRTVAWAGLEPSATPAEPVARAGLEATATPAEATGARAGLEMTTTSEASGSQPSELALHPQGKPRVQLLA